MRHCRARRALPRGMGQLNGQQTSGVDLMRILDFSHSVHDRMQVFPGNRSIAES
jgi:hypothetical protein